jgi:hypothetical protein
MAACDVCGNEYDKPMVISIGEATHTFDSFECAIHAIAPRCTHCQCTIVGHGIEGPDASMYCCGHCARASGVEGVADRA